MHLFFTKCAILLLSILTWNCTVAYVENAPRPEITPAKLLTRYLKVPWMNLNSSWKDYVASSCRDDIITLFESADAGEIWALRMLDASSKIPAGLITGNLRDLGMYDECIGVKGDHNPAHIYGRHCIVSMSMASKVVGDDPGVLWVQKLSVYNPTPDVALNFAASVCLPSSCGVEDVEGFVNASIQGTPELAELEVDVAEVTCSRVKATSDDLTLGTILVISFFAAIALVLIFGTVCEFVVKARSDSAPSMLQTLAEFSLRKNAIKLISTEIPPGAMPAIYGIKCLCLCVVVMGHRLVSTFSSPLLNPLDAFAFKGTWIQLLIMFGPLVVDTYLLISGFLMSHAFLSLLRSKAKVNILELYLHRYIRLTPCMLAVMLGVIFIFPRFESGPLWETILGVSSEYCRKNGWANLLYVHNLVTRKDMCMLQTWYLALEMQLFLLCPILLFPLFYRPKLGLVMSTLILIASVIVPVVQILANEYNFVFNSSKTFLQLYEILTNFHTVSYNRASPYIVGILLGYYVVNKKGRLTRVQVAFNWTLACILVLFSSWSSTIIQPIADVYDATGEVVHFSLGRIAWCLACAWVIYAFTQGHGGPVARFLAHPIFVPINRLSYAIYLISPMIQIGLNATARTAQFYTIPSLIQLALSDMVISIVAGFVLNLCFESPMVVLEKMLRAKRSSANIKDPVTEKKEKPLTTIKQYPDISNVQIVSDSSIETRMLQPDFWRTVSDVLKTSGKRPTKTPAEWVKAWQDWKSHVSENNRQSVTSENVSQNESEEIETGISTLEKELVIFLATVSSSLDDITNVEELGIQDSAAFQSVACDSETAGSTKLRKRRDNAKKR